MAEGKNSFTAYCDWKNTFEALTDDEAGRLIKHIFRYVNDENPTTNDRIVLISFEPIRATLKRDLKKWLSICERNRVNGKSGGRPKNPSKPTGLNGLPKNPSKPDSDSDSDSDSDKEVKGIPSFDEFKKYALSKKETTNIQSLKLKYDSWVENDWKTGGEKPRKISNWKTTLLNTLEYLKQDPPKPIEKHQKSYDELFGINPNWQPQKK